MQDSERVKLLESFQNPYPSYTSGCCAIGNDAKTCPKRNPESCRACRQQNEAKK